MNYLTLNIRYLRKSKNLTQFQLAEHIGTKRTNIATWEKTSKSIKVDILINISEYFHVSIDDLLLKDLSKESKKAGETEDNQVSEPETEYTGNAKESTLLIEENENFSEVMRNMSASQLKLISTIERLMDRIKELERGQNENLKT